MATLGTLISRTRDRLNEATARFWTDDQLKNWINEGQRDVARRLEVIQSETSVNIVAETNDYTPELNIVRIHRVEYVDSQGVIYALEYRDFNSMDSVGYGWVDVSATGRPIYYTVWGVPPNLRITLFPKPDESVANGLRIYYFSYPDDMASNSDELSIPGGWEDLIVDYCEYSALRKNKDQRWQEAKQLYEQHIEEMRQQTRRWTDQPGMLDWYQGRNYLNNYMDDWY